MAHISTPFGNLEYDENGKASQFTSGYGSNPNYPLTDYALIGNVSGSFGTVRFIQKREDAFDQIIWDGDVTGYSLNGSRRPYLLFGISKDNNVYTVWYIQSDKINLDEDFDDDDLIVPGGSFYSYNAYNFISGSASDIFEMDWDEPTHPDYNPNYDPTVPQGGENADIAPIMTEPIDDWDNFMPYDPESALTTHNNLRMMQPYRLTATDWLQLGFLFWKDADVGTSFFQRLKQLLSTGAVDPMASIAGLIRLPFNQGVIQTNGSGHVFLGGLELTDGSQYLTADYVSSRWSRIGYSIDLKESFGTYFDYTRTRIEIYLPYVGQFPIDAAEIMAGTLSAQYTIDVYTGDLICTLKLQKNAYGRSLNSVILRQKGNCALPCFYSRGDTQGNTQNIFNGMLGAIGNIRQADQDFIAGATGLAKTGASMLMGQRVQTQRGGSVSGASGWTDIQYPYLIISRDVPIYPENWRHLSGAQQAATFTVGSLSGFTRFSDVHVEISGATAEENQNIESWLTQGIII